MDPVMLAALERLDPTTFVDDRPSPNRAHAARKKVYLAVKAGRLVRGPCERAGEECSGRIEGHHDDYDRPLDVRWLCIRHHREVEREQGQVRRHRAS